MSYAIGDAVSVRSCACTVRFVGETHFADGVWIGIEFPKYSALDRGIISLMVLAIKGSFMESSSWKHRLTDLEAMLSSSSRYFLKISHDDEPRLWCLKDHVRIMPFKATGSKANW